MLQPSRDPLAPIYARTLRQTENDPWGWIRRAEADAADEERARLQLGGDDRPPARKLPGPVRAYLVCMALIVLALVLVHLANGGAQ